MVLLTVLGSAAWGADKGEELVNRAVELRRSGDDQGAYPLLQQAYGLGRSPRAAGQLGLCEQALGRWTEAETHVTEALKSPGDPWVKKSRATMEQSLVAIKSHIGRIEIAGEPTGAEVLVNGNVVGHLPLDAAVRVAAGDVDIELRAPGRARTTRSVRVEGGQYQKVVLRSEPEAVPVPVAPPPVTVAPSPAPAVPSAPAPGAQPAGAPASDTPPSAMPPPLPSAETAPMGSTRGAMKWVAWGVGAGALVLGIIEAGRQNSLGKEFDSGCGIDRMGVVRMLLGSGLTRDECVSLKERSDAAYRWELVGLIGAGVLAGAGLALWLTEPRAVESGQANSTALACSPGLLPGNGPWLGCRLRF